MQHRQHTERLHDLDALRAWAMLLGIVLHAAWMMTPVHWGAPIHDCDGALFPQWLVWFIHMFRLQAFFLIAGLFAHLVFQRQGAGGFVKHRLTRIGIPLVVGCLVIYPVWFLQDAWAGILRGRIQTTDSFWSVFQTQIGRSYREMLDTFHLWFLYDLLLIYGLTLVILFLLRYLIDRRGLLRSWINSSFRWLMQSPFLLLLLAFPSALLLLPGKFWSGIEAYPVWLRPDWPGVIHYWIFFTVGWFLYANLDLLEIVRRSWVQRLTIGTVLSVALFGVYMGYVREHITAFYPAVEAADVRYTPLRRVLLTARDEGPQDPVHQIWSALTPDWQAFLAGTTHLTPDEQAGLAQQLTDRVVADERFENLEAWNLGTMQADAAGLVGLETLERNRKILEFMLGEGIAAQITQRSSVQVAKVAYMAVYAFGMWLLVFGFVGFFHRFFSRPSPATRYLADSSYWLYIIHLNILFQLAIWVADVPMTWPVKLAFYCTAAVLIMIPSYHWFVRSTFIGQVLNGRKYPYVPLRQSPLFNWIGGVGTDPIENASLGRACETVPTPHILAEIPVDVETSVADTTSGSAGSSR